MAVPVAVAACHLTDCCVRAQLPWFSFMDFECPQFRAYSALAVIAPLLSVALTLAPGLVRGSRLIGTVVPKSAVPTMLLRISPALHVIAMGTAVSVLAQLLGNVVALIGLALLLRKCASAAGPVCACRAWK